MKDRSSDIRDLVGAIVLVTQDVERYLKFATPFMGVQDQSMEAILAQMDKVKRQTLGQLVGCFLDNSRSDSVGFEKHFEDLVKVRNEIVHHFSEVYGSRLRSGDSAGVVSALQLHLTNIKYFRSALVQMVAQILELLCEVTLKDSPSRHLFEELRMELTMNAS